MGISIDKKNDSICFLFRVIPKLFSKQLQMASLDSRVEHLPSKHEALSSNTSTAIKKDIS
jgi:hypothetical protein